MEVTIFPALVEGGATGSTFAITYCFS